ncbi:hypothetical protein NIES4103_61930 [Nostoc sp. NIES-4103]|nr:hypothetical protein NIES4103_61930 [Nostoc sp. NIES-4103]
MGVDGFWWIYQVKDSDFSVIQLKFAQSDSR